MWCVIRHRCKFFLHKNTRSLKSSAIFNENQKDGEKTDESFDEEYWQSHCKDEHPIGRTFRVMSKQMRQMRNDALFWKEPKRDDEDDWEMDSTDFPEHTDVLILGDGAIGNSIAYWLKTRGGESFSTIVVQEKDTFKMTSPVLSAGGLRMQYTLDENIEMSMFSADFIREAKDRLEVSGMPPVDVKYHPTGFLNLATEEGAEKLEYSSQLQNSIGVRSVLLTPAQLNEKFPWLNTDNIVLGSLGLDREGYFDADALIEGYRNKATLYGGRFLTGEVKGFVFSRTPNMAISSEYRGPDLYRKLNHAVIKTADGKKKVVQFSICVIAAGHLSAHIARLAKIGRCTGVLSVPLPLVVRKRYVYSVTAPGGPGLNTPITTDPSGFYFRRHGLANEYMIGYVPQNDEEELPFDNLSVDPHYFHEVIRPKILRRVPSLKNLEINATFSAFCDHNLYDENGVIGPHPLYSNVLFATGFGLNSIHQSPAIGRAISELIVDSGYHTIDLTRLGFDRFITKEPHQEMKIS